MWVRYVPYILSRNKVEDYDKWFSVFNSSEGIAARKAGGVKSLQIFRNQDDPTEVIALIEWESLDSARKYYRNMEFLKRQPMIGVYQWWIDYLDEVMRETP
jgi:heme-degrading monooxygenase HmoA